MVEPTLRRSQEPRDYGKCPHWIPALRNFDSTRNFPTLFSCFPWQVQPAREISITGAVPAMTAVADVGLQGLYGSEGLARIVFERDV